MTIWVVTVCSLLCVLAGLGVAVGGIALGNERARTAADLGALAGAKALVGLEADPCGHARAIAAANRGSLTGCVLDGPDLRVWVLVSPPPLLSRFGIPGSRAHARAGPVLRDPEAASSG